MRKRFIDADRWDDPWFRGLPANIKLLWSYLCDYCDYAGVWKCDWGMASFRIGVTVSQQEALENFNIGKERVVLLEDGNYMQVIGFIEFQNKHIRRGNKFHDSIFELIDAHGKRGGFVAPSERSMMPPSRPQEAPSLGAKVMVQVPVMVKGQLKAKAFMKPTPEEVSCYAKAIGFDIDGGHFCDYYEARGWQFKRGQAVSSWKACVRTWKAKNYPNGGVYGKPTAVAGGAAPVPGKYDHLTKTG